MNKMKSKLFRKNNVVLVFSLIFLVLFIMTLVFLKIGFFQKTDDLVNSYFSTSENIFFINFFVVLSFIFDPLSLIFIFLIFMLFFASTRFKKDLFFLFGTSLFGGILIFLFKEISQIARPDNLYEFGLSFPSGHAVISVVLFFSIIYFSLNRMKSNAKYLISVLSFSFIVVICFSRIYLGVHWFSDIIGGLFLGGFLFLFMFYFFDYEV